jgi:pyruvate dehydrogenase E2 component (dihydrolipoamide acetyltransferase)
MPTAVKMPQLGMTMTDAKIVQWLKHEGEAVRKGEPVATIETDKLNAEVEASGDGVLRRIVAPEGSVVPVVGVMAVIGAADEPEEAIDAIASGTGKTAAPAAARPVSAGAGVVSPPAPAPAPAAVAVQELASGVKASPIARRLAADLGVTLDTVQGSGPGGRIVEADVRAAARPAPAAAPSNGYIRASPIAKRLAREHGLDLASIRGSGPHGRIIERDVASAVAAASRRSTLATAVPLQTALIHIPAGLTVRETIPVSGMRRVIAERMYASLQQMAQLTITAEADATALVELRQHLVPAAKVYGHRAPSYTDLLVSVVARVLRDHPVLNSSLVGEVDAQQVICWKEINVGVAVALERGLIVPVIKQADQKPLQQISEELADLAERSHSNRLSMDELEGGTFTITNLGQQEVDGFTPIVNPPQAAILGIGRIAAKPAVYQDQLAVRQMVTLSLTFDHRIVDGVPAGLFLRDVKRAVAAAAIG